MTVYTGELGISTDQPIHQPTNLLTNRPTYSPTDQPTHQPTDRPTHQPTDQPNDRSTDQQPNPDVWPNRPTDFPWNLYSFLSLA
mgnify:CR=1 FL=1